MSFKKCFLLLLPLCFFLASGVNAKLYLATRDIKIRATKGSHAHVVGLIKNHTTVDVTDVGSVWWSVTYNGIDGYVPGKYLKEEDDNLTAHTNSTVAKTQSLPFGITTDMLVMAIGSVLVVVVTIRQIRNYIARKKARAAYTPMAVREKMITHWYQCKHCRVAIRKDSEPGIAGCSQSMRHLWVNLGEIGDVKYICKNCSTIVLVKTEPIKEGCPNEGDHQWKKI